MKKKKQNSCRKSGHKKALSSHS